MDETIIEQEKIVEIISIILLSLVYHDGKTNIGKDLELKVDGSSLVVDQILNDLAIVDKVDKVVDIQDTVNEKVIEDDLNKNNEVVDDLLENSTKLSNVVVKVSNDLIENFITS